MEAHQRYWLCVWTDIFAFLRLNELDGEGAVDMTQTMFAAGFSSVFAPVSPVGDDFFIAGVYTPDNVGPGTHRALIIGGGVF
jgi:hypothetical protein